MESPSVDSLSYKNPSSRAISFTGLSFRCGVHAGDSGLRIGGCRFGHRKLLSNLTLDH